MPLQHSGGLPVGYKVGWFQVGYKGLGLIFKREYFGDCFLVFFRDLWDVFFSCHYKKLARLGFVGGL